MNEQQLQCFVCVAEHLNFTKAATELFLTVSTVTHHIQNLESELCTKLFTRTTRAVLLTEAGTVFYPDAREILTRLDLSKKHIQKVDKKRISVFHIGCVSYGEFPRFRHVLAQMRQAYPTIRPKVIVNDYFNLKKLFENKQLDLLLVSKQMASEIKSSSFHKICGSKTYALLAQDSDYNTEKEFAVNQTADYCLIAMHPRLVPFQNDSKLQHDILLYQQNHDFITCEDEQTAILLAQSGYGIAILPDYLLPPDLSGLTVLPIKDSCEVDYSFLCQNKDTYTKFFMDQYRSYR